MTSRALSDEDFKAGLTAVIPAMRAYARTLCNGDAALADDMAQEALLKAWRARASFQAGTNLKAWAIMIVRNAYFSERRRSWRSEALDPQTAEQTLVSPADPRMTLEVDDVRRALSLLPEDQREALILVGAGGLSYDEAAEICGLAVGTVKSRVSRARARLAAALEGRLPVDDRPAGEAMGAILGEVEGRRLKPRKAA